MYFKDVEMRKVFVMEDTVTDDYIGFYQVSDVSVSGEVVPRHNLATVLSGNCIDQTHDGWHFATFNAAFEAASEKINTGVMTVSPMRFREIEDDLLWNMKFEAVWSKNGISVVGTTQMGVRIPIKDSKIKVINDSRYYLVTGKDHPELNELEMVDEYRFKFKRPRYVGDYPQIGRWHEEDATLVMERGEWWASITYDADPDEVDWLRYKLEVGTFGDGFEARFDTVNEAARQAVAFLNGDIAMVDADKHRPCDFNFAEADGFQIEGHRLYAFCERDYVRIPIKGVRLHKKSGQRYEVVKITSGKSIFLQLADGSHIWELVR